MAQPRSILGHKNSIKTVEIPSIEAPKYDEYDMLVISRNEGPSELGDKYLDAESEVIHKTLMINSKYIQWAFELVSSRITRKKPGLGTVLKELVLAYDKELNRKRRMLTKLRNLFDLIVDDTNLLMSNKKHGRVGQADYYQERVLKGRDIFKRLYYEFMFDDQDLVQAFTKDEVKQMHTWVISSKENLLGAIDSWSTSYERTSSKRSFQ